MNAEVTIIPMLIVQHFPAGELFQYLVKWRLILYRENVAHVGTAG